VSTYSGITGAALTRPRDPVKVVYSGIKNNLIFFISGCFYSGIPFPPKYHTRMDEEKDNVISLDKWKDRVRTVVQEEDMIPEPEEKPEEKPEEEPEEDSAEKIEIGANMTRGILLTTAYAQGLSDGKEIRWMELRWSILALFILNIIAIAGIYFRL